MCAAWSVECDAGAAGMVCICGSPTGPMMLCPGEMGVVISTVTGVVSMRLLLTVGATASVTAVVAVTGSAGAASGGAAASVVRTGVAVGSASLVSGGTQAPSSSSSAVTQRSGRAAARAMVKNMVYPFGTKTCEV